MVSRMLHSLARLSNGRNTESTSQKFLNHCIPVMYIFLLTYLVKIAASDRIVYTNSGFIRGVDSLEENVEAFLGIPYAEPPVGELRFAKPIPKKQWSEIYNATNLPPPCSQYDLGPYYFSPDISNMSEDCLYLNIWAPKSKPSDGGLKPVVVYIHHGYFVAGSSNVKVHDGSHPASHGNLVVATINYRLGTLGYFLAYIKEADGNMGMFDQIMAIKWIKDNAEYFGGDPDNLVLMGSSAGAYSISAHMISPLSKNLFKRVILQSGSIINPLFLDNNTRLFQNSKSVASLVGCTDDNVTLKNDPQFVVRCLKNKSLEDFAKAEKTLSLSNPSPFYPRVNDEFLPKSAVDSYREGQFRKNIDVMVGFTEEEGSLFLTVALHDYFGYHGRRNEINMNKIRALTLGRAVLSVFGQTKPSEIMNFYLSNVKNRSPVGYKKMLANIFGDFIVTCSTLFVADFISLKGNPVYFYKFGFRAASTPMADWTGATHLDELQYVFGNPYHDNFTPEEIEISHRLMDRWSAFAKTGNPNIPGQMPWLRYSYHNPLYMNFGQEEESIRLKPTDRCEMWRTRYHAVINPDLIRLLRNSGMNATN